VGSSDPEGGWRQHEDGRVVGVAVAFAVTYALLSGRGESALVWAVAFIFFCFQAFSTGAPTSKQGFRNA